MTDTDDALLIKGTRSCDVLLWLGGCCRCEGDRPALDRGENDHWFFCGRRQVGRCWMWDDLWPVDGGERLILDWGSDNSSRQPQQREAVYELALQTPPPPLLLYGDGAYGIINNADYSNSSRPYYARRISGRLDANLSSRRRGKVRDVDQQCRRRLTLGTGFWLNATKKF